MRVPANWRAAPIWFRIAEDMTVSSQSGINYDAFLAGDPNAAPEPATWALAGGALLVGLGVRRAAMA
jgi:hypothetical protein